MDIQAIRRANLKKLAAVHDGMNSLAAKLGYSNGSYLYQMAGPNPIREISERTARKIESTMELPQGWLDRADVAQAAPVDIDTNLIDEAIRLTGRKAEAHAVSLSPSKMTNLVALVVRHAVKNGKVDEGYIDELMQFLQ